MGIKILAFAGSARKDSFNKKLIKLAAAAAGEAGASVSLIDLRDFPLPVFDQDFEAENGLPENAKKIKALMLESKGFLLSCPEYNSSITPLLKNTLDWASRVENDKEPPLACYRGKTASLLSASPGALGGLRGLAVVRSLLSNIGVTVLPEQLAVSKAHEAFDAAGKLKDAKTQAMLTNIVKSFVQMTTKLAS